MAGTTESDTAGRRSAPPWREAEWTLRSARGADGFANPYAGVAVWAEFTHSSGAALRRPAFWDGGDTWRVRFASPLPEGTWSWTSRAEADDAGLAGRTGTLTVVPGSSGDAENRFYRHGFWRMSPGGRNLVHADGTPCLLAGDTAWALPWRATPEQAEVYAADRRAKGFNAALLMTVQPDMRATGPRDRTAPGGFAVGFKDLPDGRLSRPNPGYFREFDRLVDILVAHGIAPVYQPVFHGYGWKGLSVAGPVVPGDEYARYCRYLVARYGARPAVWLVGGDGDGRHPQIGAAGAEIEAWDAYGHPTGIHYRPHADNRAYQDAPWLDFQWCQTGHGGEHVPERVADMWRNEPVKAVANGEPTYENIGRTGKAAGWWQGHEAWSDLCAGGTMGVVYGAGSLWQWRLGPDEPGHEAWAHAPGAGWREALDFEGARYVGIVPSLFEGLPFADMAPDWVSTLAARGLSVPGRLMVVYRPEGGGFAVASEGVPPHYRVYDPRDGRVVAAGDSGRGAWRSIPVEGDEPRVVIFSETFAPTTGAG